MNNEIIKYFAKFIEKELGIIYSDFNSFQLQNRLDEIARILGLASVDELYRKVQTNMTSDVKQLMLDIATNNETSFFRDPKIFKAIRETVLVPHLKAGAKKPLRIWSAASSYGQEAYSLTILLSEFFESEKTKFPVEIFASDISSRVLERAKTGRFTQLEVQRGLASSQLVKYFQPDKENFWILNKEQRSMVRFDKMNLLDSFAALGQFDLILCRNVLIYQTVEGKVVVINKLAKALQPGGHLVLGAGESLIGLSDGFNSVKSEEAILYRLKEVVSKVA